MVAVILFAALGNRGPWLGMTRAKTRNRSPEFYVSILFVLSVLIGAGFLANREVSSLAKAVCRAMRLPLTRGVTLSWPFFYSHFQFFVAGPASATDHAFVLLLAQVLMLLGFIHVQRKHPLLNLLFVLQYAATFSILFLIHAWAPYHPKYSIGLLVSQLIWIGAGIQTIASFLASAVAQHRKAFVRVSTTVLVPAMLTLLYLPDYSRIYSRSVVPITRALKAMAASSSAPVIPLFSRDYKPNAQMRFFKGMPSLVKGIPVDRFRMFGAQGLATPGGAEQAWMSMRDAAYWAGSAWLIGSGLGPDETPLLDKKLLRSLQLVKVYPSLLGPDSDTFLYRLPNPEGILLYPYPRRCSLTLENQTGRLRLDCMNEGTWRLLTVGDDVDIESLEVDRRKADPHRFSLPAGSHDMVVRCASSPGLKAAGRQIEIVFENPEESDVYSSPCFRGLLVVTMPDFRWPVDYPRSVSSISSGNGARVLLARHYEAPQSAWVGLHASSPGGRSLIAVSVNRDLLAVLPFQGKEEKFFRTLIPTNAQFIVLQNITPGAITATEDGSAETTISITGLLSLSVDPAADSNAQGDANLIKPEKRVNTKVRLLPFFRSTDQGRVLLWQHHGTADVKEIASPAARMKALGIELGSGKEIFLSPPLPLGKADAILLKAAVVDKYLKQHQFCIRVYYLDRTGKNALRACYLARPANVPSGEIGWKDVIYYDKRNPNEEAISVELCAWQRTDLPQKGSRDRLVIQEFMLATMSGGS